MQTGGDLEKTQQDTPTLALPWFGSVMRIGSLMGNPESLAIREVFPASLSLGD
jgi:hypothetical protein